MLDFRFVISYILKRAYSFLKVLLFKSQCLNAIFEKTGINILILDLLLLLFFITNRVTLSDIPTTNFSSWKY